MSLPATNVAGMGMGMGMMNQGMMIEMIKISIMTSLLSNIGAEDSLFGMTVRFLLIVLLNDVMKIITDLFQNLKTRTQCFFTSKDLKLSDFKYQMILSNDLYSRLVINELTERKNVNEKMLTEMCNAKMEDTYFTSKTLEGAENHLFIDTGPEQFIKIHQIRIGQFIYLYSKKESIKFRLCCNTSNFDLLDYLDGLHAKHKLTYKNIFHPHCVVRGESHPLKTKITMDNIFFEQKEQMLQVLTQFKNAEWFKQRGLLHHLGILLYGAPGCSKTTYIRALSRFMEMNIYFATSEDFKSKKSFSTMLNTYKTYIIVLEDFDRIPCVLTNNSTSSSAIIDNASESKSSTTTPSDLQYGRFDSNLDKLFNAYVDCKDKEEKDKLYKMYETEKNKEPLDLAFVLNALDGIVETPGRVIIFTANHPERIDKALLRYGRIDHIIHFKKASRLIIAQILQNFFSVDVCQESQEKVEESAEKKSQGSLLTKRKNREPAEKKNQELLPTEKKLISKISQIPLPDTSKIPDYKYSHAEIYGLAKKYNNLEKVISMLESGEVDLRSTNFSEGS